MENNKIKQDKEVKQEELGQSQDIKNQTKESAKAGTVKVVAPKVVAPKTIEIVCVDCGTVRVVDKGEAFQVKRCVACQSKHRKSLRKMYRKYKH